MKFQSFPDSFPGKTRNFFAESDALRLPNAVKKLYTILVKKKTARDEPNGHGTRGFSSVKSMK